MRVRRTSLAKLNATRPERRKSFAHQKSCRSRKNYFSIHSVLGYISRSQVPRRTLRNAHLWPAAAVSFQRAETRKAHMGRKSPLAPRASKFIIVFVRASSEGLSSEKGKASTR